MNVQKRRRIEPSDQDFLGGGGASFFDQLDAQIEASGFVPQGLTMNDFQTQAEAEEDGEPKERWDPVPLPSRRKEQKRFGKPIKRSRCFFCAFVGEKLTVVPREDVNKVVEMLRQNIEIMEDAELAHQIAREYAVLRQRINSELRPGERELPAMSEATVLHHIRRHTQDPEVKLGVIRSELQEARETIVDGGLFEKSSRSGQKRPSKLAMDSLEKIIKLEILVGKQDPSKWDGYAAGIRRDPNTHAQGPVAVSTKSLYEYWGNI